MNPLKTTILTAFVAFLMLTSTAICDITAILHFYPSDFYSTTYLATDSNYYTKIACDLANQTTADNPSNPDLPALTFSYSLPQNMEITSVTITSRSQQLLFSLGHLIYPIQTPILSRTGEPIPAFIAPGSSYSSTLFPADSNIVTVADPIDYSFGMGIGTILIRPVQYRIPQNELWISTDFTINIHLTTTTKTPFLAHYRSTFAQESIKKYLKGIVQNKSDVDTNLPTPVLDSYNYPTNPQNIPPEYIIITSTAFAQEMVALKNWKRVHGIPAEVYTVENDIYPHYPGRDNAERVRNFIKDKDTTGAWYVLLAGNRDVVPIRYTYPGNVSTPPALTSQQICDLYYADLNGDWDVDGDGVWGEPTQDHPDLGADIFVGRVAISHTGDAANGLDKLSNYVEDPGGLGSDAYLANVIISSADQMRDAGRAVPVGNSFDNWFHIDSLTLAEMPNGHDLNPTSPTGQLVVSELSGPSYGYNISVNHGSPDWYCVRSESLNIANRSGVTSSQEREIGLDWECTCNITNYGREYVHSSVACDLGGMDCLDWYHPQPPFTPTCFAERNLLIPGGCVSGTFNTRWGWCGSSYHIEVT